MFDWETHQNITIPRHALAANGGPQSFRGMLSTADYKGGKGTQILSYGVCSYLLCGFLIIKRLPRNGSVSFVFELKKSIMMIAFLRIILNILFSILLVAGLLFLLLFIFSVFNHDPLINRTVANISAFLCFFLFIVFFSAYIIFLLNKKNNTFIPLKNREVQAHSFDISVEGYVNSKDYLLTQIEISLGGKILLFFTLSFFTLLICFAIMTGPEKEGGNNNIAASIVAIGFIALVINLIIRYRDNVNRNYIRNCFNSKSVLRITDMSVMIEKEAFATTMIWSQFDKVAETKKYIQLYYDKTDAVWIDKRRLNPMQLFTFRTFLSSIVLDRYSFKSR